MLFKIENRARLSSAYLQLLPKVCAPSRMNRRPRSQSPGHRAARLSAPEHPYEPLIDLSLVDINATFCQTSHMLAQSGLKREDHYVDTQRICGSGRLRNL